MGLFGTRLMRERERREITLEDISKSTKIRVRFLVAIEQEHFEELPGAFFTREFIRAYALHVGIDAEQAIADYLAAQANQPEPGPARSPVAPLLRLDRTGPRLIVNNRQSREFANRKNAVWRHISWTPLGAALLFLAVGFVLLGYYKRELQRQNELSAASSLKQSDLQTGESEKPEHPEITQSSAKQTAAMGSAASEQAASTNPVIALVASRDEGRPAAAGVPVSDRSPAFGAFSVLIKAREDAWVSIIADGKRIMQETLVAAAETSVKAQDQIVIRAGNIGALDFFFNGQKLPTQGDDDEAKTLKFDVNGLRPPVPGTSSPVTPASVQQ
jgi:cytoskeletal protein RodZ